MLIPASHFSDDPRGIRTWAKSNHDDYDDEDAGMTLCIRPSQSISLGTLTFAPNEVRPYAAHICVRNNFTTLECATLRGAGDTMKVEPAPQTPNPKP